jgi:hypothetical protein
LNKTKGGEPMDIYEELGIIQVEPFDTFNDDLEELVMYYGRVLQILDNDEAMQELLEYCVQYYNSRSYLRFLSQIRKLKEKYNV